MDDLIYPDLYMQVTTTISILSIENRLGSRLEVTTLSRLASVSLDWNLLSEPDCERLHKSGGNWKRKPAPGRENRIRIGT